MRGNSEVVIIYPDEWFSDQLPTTFNLFDLHDQWSQWSPCPPWNMPEIQKSLRKKELFTGKSSISIVDFPWISHCNGADFHVGSPPSYTRIGLAVAPRKTASDGPRSNRWDLSHTPFPPKKISNKTLSYIILYSYIFMFIPPKNMLLVWWSIPTWEWVIFQNLLQLRQTITP